MSTALVFGANGISGIAIIRELLSKPKEEWKKIIAISRRKPVLDHEDDRVEFKSVDLLDNDASSIANDLKGAGGEEATHAFFYAYIEKADNDELTEVNTKLFKNAIEATQQACPKLKVFSLQTGYKYYGTHLGGHALAPYPWKEDCKRHEGKNFYFPQEDLLKEKAKENNWHWIVTRPSCIVGFSKGNFMSIAVTIALYATSQKHLGQPLYYPGSSIAWDLPYGHSTATNNAGFQAYLATKESAWDKAYNIDDGKHVKFKDLWPKIAEYFDVPLAEPPVDEPKDEYKKGHDVISLHPTAEWAKKHQEELHKMAKDLGRDAEMFDYATWAFLDFFTSRTWSDEADLSATRAAGWDKTVDTWEDGYKKVFDELRHQRIIPAPIVIEDDD